MKKAVEKVLLSLSVLAAASGLAESERQTFHCDISANNADWSFTRPDGTAALPAEVDGNDLWISKTNSGWDFSIASLRNDIAVYSCKVSPTNALTAATGAFVDGVGVLALGAGGLQMDGDLHLHFGAVQRTARVRLDASQTWKGPDQGTSWAEFSVGSTKYYNGYWWNAAVEAEDDVDWTLDGRIKVLLTASNHLAGVDLTVNPQARIVLVEKWSDQIFAGKIGARSLTLKGDGTSAPMLSVGTVNPATFIGETHAPSAFDDMTYAQIVNLADGASVEGGVVDYSLGRLNVTGGDSVFSGDVTVRKEVFINIDDGASLTFTGSVKVDDGASVVLSGAGALKYPSGGIDWPVSGGGTIVCDPSGGESVFRADLSGFTGKILVKSGTLLIHPDSVLNSDAEIVLEDGATKRNLTESDFGDVTVDGRRCYRDSEGFLHPYMYMNAFTGDVYFKSMKFRRYPDVEEEQTWQNGSVLVLDRHFGGGFWDSAGTLDFEGIVVGKDSTSGGVNCFAGNVDIILGERGIELNRKDVTLCIFKNNRHFKLACDQVWRGPEDFSDGRRAQVYVGGNWKNMHSSGSMSPLVDDLKWTIEGALTVAMYYPSNDISSADVTVKSPARILLSYPGGASGYKEFGNSLPWRGRLHARSLTLDGPDACIDIETLNEVPILTGELFARKLILSNGAKLKLGASQTIQWSSDLALSAGSGTGYLEGKYNLTDPVAHISADEGAVLDLTGAMISADACNAAFSATGDGIVRLSFDNLKNLGGGILIEGPAVELTGSGCWTYPLAGASGFSVASDGLVSITAEALSEYSGEAIEIAAGILVLDSVASLPEGCKVVTSGDGGLLLIDDTGFEADKHMGGTRKVADAPSFVVGEESRENETVTVSGGQMLHVFGSGLKSSSQLILESGASVCFHRSAVVASPVTVKGPAVVLTAPGIEVTFAGKITKEAAGSVEVVGDGSVVISGGAAFAGRWTTGLTQRGGTVTIRDNAVSFDSKFTLHEGRFVITNCVLSSYYADWIVGTGEQRGNALCELATNAIWYVDNSSTICIGGSDNHESRLVIKGGEMHHRTYDTVKLAHNGSGNAVFEFDSGTLVSQRRILVGRRADAVYGSAKFIWRGGVWKTGGSNPYRYGFLFAPLNADAVYGGLEFSIEGPDCVMDFDKFLYPGAISNFHNLASSRMTGKPGARLTLKGHSSAETRMVLLGFEPGGMALDLNGDPRVDVDVVGEGTPLHLGWTVPGRNGTVRCIGTPSRLVADYVVPGNGVFENAYVADHWHEGFSSVIVSNLVFGADSTYLLRPTEAGLPTLEIAGSMTLPAEMKYSVDRSLADPPAVQGAVLVSAGAGVSETTQWTAGSGISKYSSSVFADVGRLLFNYRPRGTILKIR